MSIPPNSGRLIGTSPSYKTTGMPNRSRNADGLWSFEILVPLEGGDRAIAEKLGATHSFDALSETSVAEVVELTKGGVHHAIEAVGRPQSAETTVKVLRRGGTATILGMLPPSEKVGLSAIDLLSGKKLQGGLMGSNRFPVDMPRLVDFYLQGRLHLDELISGHIGLEKINEGMDELRTASVLRNVIAFPN